MQPTGGNLFSNLKSNSPNRSKPLNQSKKTANQLGSSLLVPNPNSSVKVVNKNKEPSNAIRQVVWGQDLNQSYFSDLLKLLNNKREAIKLQSSVFNRRDKFQNILKDGLTEFLKNQQKDAQFENLYKNKNNHLGLSCQQLGFKKGTTYGHNIKLDLLWFKIIEVLAIQWPSNKLQAVKIVKKYIRLTGDYAKFYQPELEGALKPKIELIDTFFQASNINEVNVESETFINLLSKISDLYYRQYSACVSCASFLYNSNKNYIQGLAKLFDETILPSLWKSYCSVSNSVMDVKPQSQNKSSQAQTHLHQKLFSYNVKLLIMIVKLFYSVLITTNYKKCQQVFKSESNIQRDIIQRLDSDMIKFQKISVARTSVPSDLFSKMITELFLAIFPFQIYVSRDEEKIKKINQIVNKTKSQSLILIKMLVDQKQKDVEKFENLITAGGWTATTYFWRKWLGIFLKKYKQSMGRSTMQLIKLVVYVCKIVAKEDLDKFWAPDLTNDFYIYEIKSFIESTVSNIREHKYLNSSTLLPIFTKLLGQLHLNNFQPLTEFLESINQRGFYKRVYDQISNFLHLQKSNNKGNSGNNDRIVYVPEHRVGNVEQEIKFFCKILIINVESLDKVYTLIFNDEDQDYYEDSGNDLRLIISLLKMLQKMNTESESDIKCLRYIFQAIDALFTHDKTRNTLMVALGVSENEKQSYAKILKSIVNVSSKIDNCDSQFGRQCLKLRRVIGKHLNNILKISNTIEQYFPTSSSREVENIFKRLQQSIIRQERHSFATYIHQISQHTEPFIRAVPWFYYLILILQNPQLTAIDLDTIRLILLKLRIKNETSRQFSNLQLVVDMINNGSLPNVLIKCLTPVVKNQVNLNQKKKYFLGLGNLQFQTYLINIGRTYESSSVKYFNKQYKYQKNRSIRNRDRAELYQKLCGSMSILQTLLKLKLQGEFPLLQKLTLTGFLMKSLFGDQPLMFNVKYYVKLEANIDKEEQKQLKFMSLFTKNKPRLIEQELECSINLLHCIVSLFDFENINLINSFEHPSHAFKMKGYISVDVLDVLDLDKEGINREILSRSKENVLTELNRSPETIGIPTICKIMEYIILLGQGKTLYYSIMCRNYPINRSFGVKSCPQNIIQLFTILLRTLIRDETTFNEKGHVLELLSAFLQEPHFSQYIISNIFLFKQALAKTNKNLKQSATIYLTCKYLLFLNLVLLKNCSDLTLKFVKSCLIDPIQFTINFLDSCGLCLSKLKEMPSNEYKCMSLTWCSIIKEATACKVSLLLYLSIANHLISNEKEYLSCILSQFILKHSSIFLKPIPQHYMSEELRNLDLTQTKVSPQFTDENGFTLFILDRHFISLFFLNLPNSLIQNVIYQPWEVYQKYEEKGQTGTTKALLAIMHNASLALHFTNEAVVQYYYLVMTGLFQRGKYGLYFDRPHNNKLTPQIISSLYFMKFRSKNRLSSIDLFKNCDNFIGVCFHLFRQIESQIWGKPDQNGNQIKKERDMGLVFISQIIGAIQVRLKTQKQLNHQLNEIYKIVDKLIAQLNGAKIQFSLSVIVMVVQALFKLAQKIFSEGLSKINFQNKQPSIKDLRNVITNISSIKTQSLTIAFSQLKMQKDVQMTQGHVKMVQLFIMSLEMEIRNIQIFTANKNLLHTYIQNSNLSQLMTKANSMAKFLFPFIGDPSLRTRIKSIIIVFFNKIYLIETLCLGFHKQYNSVSSLHHQMFAILQNIHRNNSQQQVINIHLYGFLAQIAIDCDQNIGRQILKVVQSNFSKMSDKIGKINDIRTIQDILLLKSELGVFVSLGFQTNWRKAEFRQLMNKVFIHIQQRPLRLQHQKVIPNHQVEEQFAKRYLQQDESTQHLITYKDDQKISIFSLLVSLRTYQFVKIYILYLNLAMKFSPLLLQLCDHTFNSGPLDEKTFQRLCISLLNCMQFMQKLSFVLSNKYIENILIINRFFCEDSVFLNEFRFESIYFQNYEDSEDLFCDILETIFTLYDAAELLNISWQRFDWKSTLQWKSNRRHLFNRLAQLYQKYSFFTLNCKSQRYNKSLFNLKFLHQRIHNQLLSDI